MSTYYWVGGTGTWDGTATVHWSATSGGAAGAGPPTAADDVIFDANSMPTLTTVTVNGTSAACKSLTANLPNVLNLVFSFSANWTINGNVVFNGGGANAHPVIQTNGAGTSRTWTINGTATFSQVDFMDIVAAGTAAPFGGANLIANPGFERDTVGSAPAWWTPWTPGIASVNAVQTGWAQNGTKSYRLTQTSTAVGQYAGWISPTAKNAMPVLPNTSYAASAMTNVLTNTFPPRSAGVGLAIRWYDSTGTQILDSSAGGAGVGIHSQSVTAVSPPAAAYAMVFLITQTSSAVGQIFDAYLDSVVLAPTTVATPPYVDGDAPGCFWYGTPGNSASGYTIGDCQGNSGIVFPPSRTLYWVATAGGNFTATTSWATTSGGASGAPIPLPQDDLIFDANSITSSGRVISINIARCGRNVNFSAVRNQPSVTFNVNWNMYGDLIFGNVIISGTSTQSCRGRSPTQKFDSAGLTLTQAWLFAAVSGGMYLLQNDYVTSIANTVTTALQVNGGGFDANGHNVTCASVAIQQGTTVNMGSGTWTINGANTAQVAQPLAISPSCTVNCGTSTLVIADTSATAKAIQLGGHTYYNLTIPGGGGAIQPLANNPNLFNAVKITGPKTVTFPAGQTWIANNWTLSGSAGNPITLNSSTPGTRFTLATPYGSTAVVWGHYLALQDSLVGPGLFYAGNHSVDNGNNAGWIFADPPPAPPVPADPLAVFTPAMIVAVETSVDDPPVLPALLFDVPPFERASYEVKAVLNVIANELYRLDVARHALIQNFFPLLADVLLGLFEQLLGLPVNPPASLDARHQLVATYMGRLKSEGRGLDWVSLISQAVGTQNWNYAEHDPANSFSPPAYTINVNIPQQSAGFAWPLIRDLTPAHLTVNEGYTGGFIVGSSPIGNNL